MKSPKEVVEVGRKLSAVDASEPLMWEDYVGKTYFLRMWRARVKDVCFFFKRLVWVSGMKVSAGFCFLMIM